MTPGYGRIVQTDVGGAAATDPRPAGVERDNERSPVGEHRQILAGLRDRLAHAVEPVGRLRGPRCDRDVPKSGLLEQRCSVEIRSTAVRALGDRLGGLEGDRERAALADEGSNAAGRLAGMVDLVLALS